MTELEAALADITVIRAQMARGTEFRGYGPMTLAATGALAIVAGVAQAVFIPDAVRDIDAYLALWIGTACVSIALVALETVRRSHRVHSGLAQEMLRAAVEQFVPPIVAGGLLTIVLVRTAPDTLYLLPGLWQILFSLGVCASARFLPRGIFVAGIWYLATGLISVCFATGDHALSPFAMVIPFGVGQILVAGILYKATKSG